MGCGASSSPEERIPSGGEEEIGEEEVGEEEDIAEKVEEVADVNNNGHRPKTSNPNNDRYTHL